MKIREATVDDKTAWDSFVDSEEGTFYQYFDWKLFYEARGNQFIPLMIESDSKQLVGILSLVKEKHFLYSLLVSHPEGGPGGVLLKKDLPDIEKTQAINTLVEYIELSFSNDCADLTIAEGLSTYYERNAVPGVAFVDNGFRYTYNVTNHLPCNHVMELKQPFEEHIWKNLWPSRLRQKINKAMNEGVTIIHDRELKYKTQFLDMLAANYQRHHNRRSIFNETEIRLDLFRDRSKLYIGFKDDKPIVSQLCHYTPSTCFLAKLGSYSRDTGHASKLCIKTAIEDACNAGLKFVDFDRSSIPSVATFKERFQFTRVPLGSYEKTFSSWRYRIHQASMLMEELRHDKLFIWNNRQKILKSLFGYSATENNMENDQNS